MDKYVSRLDYHPLDSNINKIKEGLSYRVKPHKKDNEVSAMVFLYWDKKSWIAHVKGIYKDSKNNIGWFEKGRFMPNLDACKKICDFFKINFKDCENNIFIEEISKSSPSDLEKTAEYQRKILVII